MRIVIVTPRSPFQGRGADEQDRLGGIKWFINEGWEVVVITKTLPSDLEALEAARKNLGIRIESVPYRSNKSLRTIFKRIFIPRYWDGAAYEYFDPAIQSRFEEVISQSKTNLAWFDYTYLWPLYPIARNRNVPTITRSINFEPAHFLGEDGYKPFNLLRALPKLFSEWRVSKGSDWLFAITPNEEKLYSRLGAKTSTLPLRGLPEKLEVPIKLRKPSSEIHLGFVASTYSVKHNLQALIFLINEVLPRINGAKKLYFTGMKLPEKIKNNLPSGVECLGFLDSLNELWNRIDISVMPSLFGAGMQQKIFEPLSRGVPAVISPRAIAGYPFKDSVHFRAAVTAEQFARAIEELSESFEERKKMSSNSRSLSQELFSKEKLDEILKEGIEKALNK